MIKRSTYLTGAVLFMAALGALASRAVAQDPPQVELLPKPNQTESEKAQRDQFWFHDAYYRRSRYEVWDYYGVDRYGHFRPRVAYVPGGGSFYLINGKPFPWVSLNSQEFMPYVFDSP